MNLNLKNVKEENEKGRVTFALKIETCPMSDIHLHVEKKKIWFSRFLFHCYWEGRLNPRAGCTPVSVFGFTPPSRLPSFTRSGGKALRPFL